MLTGLRAGEAGLIFREQPTSDFGIDAQFEVKEGSTATGRLIAAQIKAGRSQFANETEGGFWHYPAFSIWLASREAKATEGDFPSDFCLRSACGAACRPDSTTKQADPTA